MSLMTFMEGDAMNTKVVIFDKDGTLIKFDPFWVSVTSGVIDDIIALTGREMDRDEFFDTLGISDGKADADGLLCAGTYEQIGTAIHGVLSAHGADFDRKRIIELTIAAYDLHARDGVVEPTCDNIREKLLQIKKLGIRLLVVTTDNRRITDICLGKLGIADLFDKIYTDDGEFPPKPNPKCIKKYSAESGIAPDNMIMVGDTMTDVRFARNCGMAVIGIGETEQKAERLRPHADAVIPDISHVIDVIRGRG